MTTLMNKVGYRFMKREREMVTDKKMAAEATTELITSAAEPALHRRRNRAKHTSRKELLCVCLNSEPAQAVNMSHRRRCFFPVHVQRLPVTADVTLMPRVISSIPTEKKRFTSLCCQPISAPRPCRGQLWTRDRCHAAVVSNERHDVKLRSSLLSPPHSYWLTNRMSYDLKDQKFGVNRRL